MKGKDRKGKIQKAPLESTSKWFTNVAKSLGFATQDIVREMIPSMYEFAEENVNAYREVVSDIRDNSMSERMVNRVMDQTSPMIKLVNKGIENVLEDIKTGNFYNQQRDDELTAYYDKKADEEMFGGSGGDGFDDEDFGFGGDIGGDDDFNEDDMFIDDDSSNDAKPAVQPVAVVNQVNQQPNLMPVAKAITNSNVASTTATLEMVQGVAKQEKTFEIQRTLRDTEFRNTLFGILGTMSENLGQLVLFQSDNQSKLVGGAISFFGEQIDLSKQIMEAVKGDDRTPEQIRDDERAKNTESKQKEDIFLSEGGLDFSAYFKNITDNVRHLEELEDVFDMSSMFFDSDEEDMMRMVTQPLKFIPQAVVKSFIPQVTQDSIALVDETFSAFTSALMAKLNAWGDNEDDDSMAGAIKSLIGRTLGYKQENKTSANLGKYEKGPVPFDGITRRTITDVIPTYLRRIESAITNTNERVYDYNTGKFRNLEDMIRSAKDAEADQQMTGQSTVKIYLERAISKLKMNKEDEDSFKEDVNEYFKAMNDGQKMINPFIYRNLQGDEVDELDDNLLFLDPNNKELFRTLLQGLDQKDIMKMVGQNVFKTVKNRTRFYEDIEKDNTLHGYRYANDNSFISKDYEEDSVTGKLTRKSAFKRLDGFGKTTVDYVRDIRSILLHGIDVFIAGGRRGSAPTADAREAFFSEMNSEVGKEEKYKADKKQSESDAFIRDNRDKRDIHEINKMSESEILKIVDFQDSDSEQREYNWFQSLTMSDGGRISQLKQKLADKVIELTDKPTKAINDFLYKIMFGSNEEDGQDFDSYFDLAKMKLSAFHMWTINNVYTPVKESLIGPEGLVTKLKESKFVKAITDKKNMLLNKLLGEKDLDGNRTGGLLSTFRNATVDLFKGVKHYFTGESYKTSDGGTVAEDKDALLRRVKRGAEDGFTRMKQIIFGDSKTGDKGIVLNIGKTLIDGINSFRRSMFGEASMEGWKDKDRQKSMEDLANSIAERAPRTLGRGLLLGLGNNILFSKAGMLGSVFLPGGPIGGILVGTGVSILLESDRFKNWLFGEKDPDNIDRRLGGFIPKGMQDFYHDNKKTFKMGGLIGAGFGLLPSFFLPGGPLTGAILGIGAGLLTKSDMFQRFLYGDDFENGDKKLKNGVIGKAFAKAKNWMNKELNIDVKQAAFLGTVGGLAGAMGLLPSFFLPGGPIGGALLGVGAGIIASSNKFQTWLFGEEGFDGKRSGGLIDKFKTWFDIEIFDSLKITLKTWGLKISDFFQENIAEPFLSALDPMKNIVIDAVDGVKSIIRAGWDKINDSIISVFKDNVIKPFGESLTKYVVNPLKKLLNTSFSILGKLVGTVLSAPFRLLGLLGGRVDKKVKKGKATDEEKEQRQKYHDAKDERQRKREERRRKVQEDIDAMKDKQSKDREFFKRDGRFRNQEAKEKYERKEREKELWYQQHIAESGAETAERLENIDGAISDMLKMQPNVFKSHEQKLFDELQKLRQKLSEQLEYWKERGFTDTRYMRRDESKDQKPFEKPQDPFFMFNNTKTEEDKPNDFKYDMSERIKMTDLNRNVFTDAATEEAKKYQDPKINEIADLLRRKGQSHAAGLEQVPYDGYIAELHEGEKIVPADKQDKDKERESSKQAKEKHSWLKSIRKNTKVIADEVKDQLYGVGSNLHHIRKILQHSFGMKDDDVENLEDKNVSDYGFFGKLFRKVKNNITTPFEFIKDNIMRPVEWVKEKIGNVVDGVQNAISNVVNTLGKVVNSLVEVPGKIINVTLDVASTVLKGGAKVLVKGLELGLKATETVISDVYKATRFVVSSIAKSFVPALVGAGKLAGKVLQGLGTAGKFAIETVVGFGKGMYTVTKDILGFGYNLTKDVVKGVTKVGATLFKGGLKLVKGALTGVKNVIKGGFGLVGGALGAIKSKVTGTKEGVQQVQVVGGNLDFVESIGEIGKLMTLSFVNKVFDVHKIGSINKVDRDVNVRIRTKSEQRDIRKQRARDLLKGRFNIFKGETEDETLKRFRLGDRNEDVGNRDDVSIGHKNKNEVTNDIQNGELNPQKQKSKEETNTEKGKEKQSYKDQIKDQTEQTKKEKKEDERQAEAKKDREHVTRLTSDYVQDQKKKKKQENLDMQYKTETMRDIDSTEKTTVKQFKFWQNLLGKNGVVHTKLSAAWAWLLRVAPIALAWFKGTAIARLLGGIFGGTGFFTALKGVLAALAPGLVALFIDNLDKSKRDERAEKYNLSDDDAYLGVGDEKRYDAETGEYILNQDRKEARTKVLKNTVRDVAKNNKIQKLGAATKNVGRNIGGLASKAFSKVSSTRPMVKVASAAGKGKNLLAKFLRLLKSATSSLISFIGNKLGNSKVSKSAAQIMKPILSKFSGTAGAKILQKFGTKISAFIAKKGAGAATFFILDGLTAIWDLGTGQTKSETANLFAVKQDQVDAKMRTISAALKAFTNFSIIGVINLANEITSEMFGINFLRSIACAIYNFTSSGSKSDELEKNQKALEAEVAQYNQEHGTNVSKEAYLDKVNPSVFGRIMNNSWVRNFTSAFDKGDAANALGKNKDDLSLWDRVKYFGGHTANSFLNIFRSKENKRTDSEFLIGKKLIRGENGLPVLDEKGNPMYEEDVKAGKVTSDGKVLKEGADTKTTQNNKQASQTNTNVSELQKKYGANAGMGDGAGNEADYQDITANFDAKATDANTWLENKSNDQNTLMRSIGAGFDNIKRVFFRWYSGDSKDTDRLVNKADDKVNLHDNRIWRNFGAFNWLTNLFKKDAEKLTENAELDTISTFFDNTSQSVGAWILSKMNDAKSLLARIQAGFNSLTGSTLNIFGSDIKIENSNSNNSNKKLNFGDIVKNGIKNGINTMISTNPVVGAFKAIGSGIGKLFGKYEQGTPWVPDTQLALIHQGEMIVPAEHNPMNPDNQEKFDDFKYDISKDTNSVINNQLPVLQSDIGNKIVVNKETTDEEITTKKRTTGSFALDLLKAYRRITSDNLKIASVKTIDVNLKEGAVININGIENISDEIIDAIKSKIDDKFTKGKYYIGFDDEDDVKDEDTKQDDEKSSKSDKDNDKDKPSKTTKDTSYYDRHKDDSDYSMEDDGASYNDDSSSSSSGGSSYSGGGSSSSSGDSSSDSSYSDDSSSSSSGGSSYSGGGSSSSSGGGSSSSSSDSSSKKDDDKKDKDKKKDDKKDKDKKKDDKKDKDKKKDEDKGYKPNTLFGAIRKLDEGFKYFHSKLNVAGDGNSLNTADRLGKSDSTNAGNAIYNQIVKPFLQFNKTLSGAADGNNINTVDRNRKGSSGESVGAWFNKNIITPFKNVGGGFKDWHEAESKKNAENVKTIKTEGAKIKDNVGSWINDNIVTPFKNVGGGFKDWHETESKKNAENVETIKTEGTKIQKSVGKWFGGLFNTAKQAGTNVLGGFRDWHETESEKNKENLKTLKSEAYNLYTRDDDKANILTDTILMKKDKNRKANFFSRAGYQLTKPVTHMLNWFMPEGEHLGDKSDRALTFAKGAAFQGSLINKGFVKPAQDMYQGIRNVAGGFKEWHDTENKKNAENVKVIKEETGKIKDNVGKWISNNVITPIKNVGGGFKDWHETESKKNKENVKVIKEEGTKIKNNVGNWINDNVFTPIKNVGGGFKDWHETESKKNKENLKVLKEETGKAKDNAGKWINDNIFTPIKNVGGGFKDWHETESKKNKENLNTIKDSAIGAKNKAGDWINKNIFSRISDFDKAANKQIDQVKKDATREKNDIGNWLNNKVFKRISDFDKAANKQIDQVKKDATREKNDIGNWLNDKVFSKISGFDKAANKQIDQVKKDANREKNDIGNWLNNKVFSKISGFDKNANKEIDKVKKDANREKNDIGNWLNNKVFSKISGFDKAGNKIIQNVKGGFQDWHEKDSNKNKESAKTLKSEVNKMKDSAGNWINQAKTSLLSTISKNLTDSEVSTDKQSQRDKKAKEASNRRSQESKKIHDRLTEGYNNLKESAGNWADETKNYIVDQYSKNISTPLDKSSKELQKQFAKLSKDAGNWLNSAKETVLSGWSKTTVGKATGRIVSGAKSLVNKIKSNDSSNKNLKNNTKTPDKSNQSKNNNNNNKSLWDKAKDKAKEAGDWVKGKIDDAKKAASDAVNNVWKWVTGGKGGLDTLPLKAQVKPKNYIFRDDEYKYKGSDKGRTDGGLRDKGNTHNFPFYSQLDQRWSSDKLIGGDSIGRAGCGPTAAAMVLTHLTGERITPDTMAKIGAENLPGYANYRYFPSIASKFKLNYSELNTSDPGQLKSALKSGKPVILSGFDFNNSNKTPYTDEGHIVVATGVNSNQIEINDPRGPAYSGSYNASDIINGMKKAIVLEATKETREIALPSIEHLQNVYYDQDYTMSEDLPDEDITDMDSLGEAGKIKLWQKVLGYARAFKGKLKYVYGSSAIDSNGMSTDCSAFTGHVFRRAAGISLPRNSTAQGGIGTGVSSPLPADLVVWNGHVGIVADTNGNMVDAGSGTVAKERSYTTNYWRARQNKKFRRVLKNRDEMVDPTVKNHHTKIGFNGTVDPNANGGLSSGDGGAIASLDKYLFVGDSMLGNLKSSLESDSSSVQVRFKGGKTAKYWLDNFSQMPDKSKVNNVISWIGVNGILNANNVSQTTDLMDKLASKYGVAVNPMGVFPVGKNYKYKTDNAANMNPAIKKFNAKMQEYASSKGSKYIDASSGFVDDDGYLKGSQDNLHIYGKANNDKIVQNIKTSLGLGSSGSADGSSSGEGENNIPELGVFDLLSNAMSNVIASMYNGEQVDLFNGNGSSSGDGSTGVTGTGDFPKYQLNDSQIKGLANIIDHEQPGPEGKYAEASIMANLTDIKGDSNATTPNLIKKAKTWFASGESRFANPGSPTSTAINAVKDVIIGGKRTLPRYVNEHDCFGDITSATNNGKSFSKTDRNQYKQHVTKIKNKYGASGTFWGFPNSKSDPFYYTSDADRSKWGENCYSVSGSSSSTDTTSTDDGAGAGYGNPYGIFDYDELAGYGPGKPEYTESDVTDYDYLIKEFGPSAGGDASEDDYEYDYDLYARLKDEYGENAGSGPSNSLVSNIPATVNQYAYYCQRDTKWNKNAIGGHYVADSGCGPSSVAILATQLTGKTITPYAIAKATYPTHWGACAQWTLFDWFANKFGLSSKVIGSNNLSAIKSELKAGHPVIASTKFSRDPQFSTEKAQRKATPYTPGGHIIPFVGVDSANRLIVNDPQHYPYAHAYEDKFLAGKYYHMRQAWAYSGSAKVPSGIDVGGPYNGPRGTTTSVVDNTGAPAADGSTPTDGTSTSEETPSIPELGIFDKLSNAMSNVIASMYNGQQVDLFASSGSTDTSTDTTSSAEGTTNVTGSNVAEQIYNYCKDKGCTNATAAGVVGNAERESSLNPATVAKDGSLGLWQWYVVEYRNGLKALAKQEGKEWSDTGVQLKYLWSHLDDPNNYNSKQFDKKLGDGSKGSGVKAWKKLTSPEKAATLFDRCYERSAETTKLREQFARKWYNKFNGGGTGASDGSGKFTSRTYVSENEMPYYSQTDSEWNTESYGGNTLSETGCGPTSLAMIASQLTGEKITPDIVAKAAYMDGMWGENASWELFPWFARQLGLEYSIAEQNDLNTVNSMLNLGEKVVASGVIDQETDDRTPFTTYGHIVPFVKRTNDGYLINDPRGKKYTGIYKANEIVNRNSTLRKAWGYKPNENIAEYLKKSNLNPELYKKNEEKEVDDNNVKLGTGSKQYTASELYDNAGLGSKKKSGIKIALEYGIDKLREQLKTNKDEDIDGKLSAGVSAIEYGIDKLRNNKFFNRGANAKVIDKIGKMTDKYKNVIHTYRPEKDTTKSTTDNKTKKKTTGGKLTLETFLEKLNKLTSLTSGITDKLYNGIDEDDITVEPEPEDIQTDSVTRENKLIPGIPAPGTYVDSVSVKNKLIPGTPAPGIEEVQEKVTKPIREIQLDTLDRLNKIVSKISENTSKIRNTSTDMTYVKECVEQLSTAVKELQSINENTKETAENISKIQVYSENYPVSQIKQDSVNDKINKLRQKQPRNQSNRIENGNSDEYKIARMIASFDK